MQTRKMQRARHSVATVKFSIGHMHSRVAIAAGVNATRFAQKVVAIPSKLVQNPDHLVVDGFHSSCDFHDKSTLQKPITTQLARWNPQAVSTVLNREWYATDASRVWQPFRLAANPRCGLAR